MEVLTHYIRTLVNAPILTKIRSDLLDYGHAKVMYRRHKGIDPIEFTITDMRETRLYGFFPIDLTHPSIGLQSIDTDSWIRYLPTKDESDRDLQRQIEQATDNLKYDQMLVIYEDWDGNEFYISHNNNRNRTGITAHRTDTHEAVFFNWALMNLYTGSWFPKGTDPEPRPDFTYYSWMGDCVSDPSLIPPKPTVPKNDPRIAIQAIRKQLDDLERSLNL